MNPTANPRSIEGTIPGSVGGVFAPVLALTPAEHHRRCAHLRLPVRVPNDWRHKGCS